MAETDFILTAEEQRALIKFLLDQDVEFVPSLHYDKCSFSILTSPDEILALVNSYRLTGPIFVPFRKERPYEFIMDDIEKQGRTIYFISAREGTPCLDFLPCFDRIVEGRRYLTSGFVSYYKSYFVGPDRTEVKVPDEVKELYKRTLKFLRTISKRYSSGKGIRYYWVGHKAREELLSGVSASVPDLHLK